MVSPMTSLTIDFADVEPEDHRANQARTLARVLGLTGRLRALKAFTDGKSGSRVLLVEHLKTPAALASCRYVFKFDNAPALLAEVERYVELRDHITATSVFANLIEPDATAAQLRAAGDDVSAIAYRYVPDQAAVADESRALEELVRDAFDAPVFAVPWPDDCPRRLAIALRGLVDAPRRDFGERLVDHYESRWLPDVQVAIDHVDRHSSVGYPILHDRHDRADLDGFLSAVTNPAVLSAWCAGGLEADHLCRPQLAVLGTWGGRLYVRDDDTRLTLCLAPETSARAPLATLRAGQTVGLWVRRGRVGELRVQVYRERAKAAGCAVTLDADAVRVGPWLAPAPLGVSASDLRGLPDVIVAPAHGDLHPGNVHVAGGGPMLIDYGGSEPAPLGTDIARLVGSLFRNVLADRLTADEQVQVAARLVGLDPANLPSSDAVERAVRLITPWRDAWFEQIPDQREQWARHLLGFAPIGLKWSSADPDEPRRHRACLILAALAALGVHGRPTAAQPVDLLTARAPTAARDPIARYQRWLRDAYGFAVPFFCDTDEPALLEATFVQLEFAPKPDRDGPNPERRLGGTLEDLLAGRLGGAGRWLILGEPGSGKSTVTRYLATEMARRAGPVTCVFAPLAEWAAAPVDLFDFVAHRAEDGDGAGALAAELRARARGDAALWILLDGFDEVAPDRVAATRERIETLAGGCPRAVIAVTSRPIGAPRLGAFTAVRLLPLDAARQRALLQRWLGDDRGQAVWAQMTDRPALREAAGNPLLLSLVAKIVEDQGDIDVPPTRAELFRQALDLLFERGHRVTPLGLGDGLRTAHAVNRELALALTEIGGESWRRAVVEEALDATLDASPALEMALSQRWTDGAAFLDDLAVRTGIIGPHDGSDRHWRYLHRSLRERLAAEALVERGADHVAQRLAEVAGDDEHLGRWGETLGVACALLPDPLATLRGVVADSAELALRILPELTGLPVDTAVALAWSMPVDAWDGDWLLQLLARFPSGEASAAVMARVEPRLDLDRLAFAHYALEGIGAALERAAFFGAAGKSLPGPDFVLPMVDIAPGGFMMGSPADEEGRWDGEGPQHGVTLTRGFRLGTTPVTRAQYRAFDPAHECLGGRRHPVTGVSWWRAYLFAAWAGCLLPTEAEWEYACRAGTTTRYWSGDGEADLARVGWYNGNSGDSAHPVGEKPANPWGLYDMHGNVDEWTADWGDSYSADPQLDPAGPPRGVVRVFRGGSFVDDARLARSAYRSWWHPAVRFHWLGFRVAAPPQLDLAAPGEAA